MDSTPYGDGRRIMVWLAYLQESAGGFSYWLPFRNGGMPLFADPEQFWALMPFVDTLSPYANLQLNILLFIYCIFPFFPAWFIARRIGITPLWAGLAALFVSFNGYMIITEQSARFATFINFTTLLTVLAILLRPQKNIRDFITIIFLVGACLTVAFQYAIVHILLIYSFLLFSQPTEGTNKQVHFFKVNLITAVIGAAAVMLAMVLILPVFGHLLETKTAQGQFFYLTNVKNGLGSFLGLVVPFTAQGDPVFTSLLALPAAIIAWTFGLPESIKSLVKKLSLPVAFCFLFFLMSLPFIGAPISSFYASIPIISTIRQLSYALGIASLLLPIFALGVFSFVRKKEIIELGKTSRILCSAYFAISAILALYFGLGKQNLLSDISVVVASILLLFVALFLLIPTHFKGVFSKIVPTFGSLGVLLAFISVLFLVPSAFYEYHPDRPNLKLHVTNERKFIKFSDIVSEYPTHYSKVLTSGSGNQLGFMYSRNRTLGGFSTYMPESFPYVFSLLNPSINWATQRPHWIKRVPCNQLDEKALSMMHVNYLICVKKRVSSNLPKGFELVETQKRLALLKRTDAQLQPLRVYCRYRSAQNKGPDAVRDDVLNSYSNAQLLVPETVEKLKQDADCPKDGFADANITLKIDRPDEMLLNVVSKHSGVLVIPDNFNSGWQAEVNGSSQLIIPAFFAFRGIQVDAGKNTIHLKYRDRYFELGLILSSVTMALLCLIWIVSFVFSFIRRKKV